LKESTMHKLIPALLLLAACGGDDTSGTDPDAAPVTSDVTEVSCGGATIAATITTTGFNYSPTSATISVGEIVQFSPSSTSHDVNGDDPGLTVGLGGDKCFSFDAAGTYGFHCTPHGFQGSIVVQ